MKDIDSTDTDHRLTDNFTDTEHRITDNLEHARLGHRCIKQKHLRDLHNLRGKHPIDFCAACATTKSPLRKYNRKKDKTTRAKKPFLRVHCDLLEAAVPSKYISHEGGNYTYALVIVCDYTRMAYSVGLQSKDEAVQAFDMFLRIQVLPRSHRVYEVRCDPGGEFEGRFKHYCRENSIMLIPCPTRAHQLNGIAERMIRTLGEMTRSMLVHAQRPAYWWYYALKCATWLINRLPTSANEQHISPYAKLTGKHYDHTRSRTWGCPCYRHNGMKPGLTRTKADPHMFVGYSESGYLCYNPASNRIVTASLQMLTFDESFTVRKSLNIDKRMIPDLVTYDPTHLDLKVTEPDPYYRFTDTAKRARITDTDITDRRLRPRKTNTDTDKSHTVTDNIDIQHTEKNSSAERKRGCD